MCYSDSMNQSIKEHIAIWKVRNGKNNADLAKEIGISRTALLDKIRGDSEWKFNSEIMAMCHLFGCSPNQLIGLAP